MQAGMLSSLYILRRGEDWGTSTIETVLARKLYQKVLREIAHLMYLWQTSCITGTHNTSQMYPSFQGTPSRLLLCDILIPSLHSQHLRNVY